MKTIKKGTLILSGLCALLCLKSFAQPNYPKTPAEAGLIYTDLEHFIEAYNELDTNKDTLQVLQTLYFDRGSTGLKEYINRHKLSAELLRDSLRADPGRYALLPGFLDSIAATEQMYKELMQEFSSVLPNAMYPPTYLLVGANRGIGQASGVGQLITVTRPVDDRKKLQKIMVHELAHFQQAMSMGLQKYSSLYSTPHNLLGMCLREGGAEFVTSLVLGDITQARSLEFIEKDEALIKSKFLEDLETETQNQEYWLDAWAVQKEYPKLLGYAMGYKINQAYYEQAADKAIALQEILRMDDAEAFVSASGYFKNRDD
ncbi:MAG: DUF2268 domain-containing putative Zn-dependent protease [Robiginitalea sp.]|uniref:DUF2268 domain-containing putative Zn-dependent protease n=1 Tax=Robiginitalea sp. TaxID=1902411 RepID=UPI003C71ADD4